MDITVTVRIAKLDDKLFIGMCEVGGVKIRGGSRESVLEAAQATFAVLAGQSGNTDDAKVGVALELRGTTAAEVGSGADATAEDDLTAARKLIASAEAKRK